MIIVDCCSETSIESRTDFQYSLTAILICIVIWYLHNNQQLSSKNIPITNDILGYRQDLGFSVLSISSTTEVKIDLKGMEASTNCFFVVVGGKYLRLMENVLKIVDNVTEAVGRRPIAVIYVTKEEKITSFYDQPFHLPLVNNLTYIKSTI